MAMSVAMHLRPMLEILFIASAGTDALRNLNGKGLYAQAKITDTHKARIRPLSSREHNMRRVLRGLVLRHRKSQRGQVKTGK